MLNPKNVINETPATDLLLIIVMIWGMKSRAFAIKLIENPNSTNQFIVAS